MEGREDTENSEQLKAIGKPKSQAVGRFLRNEPREKGGPHRPPDPMLLYDDTDSGLDTPTEVAPCQRPHLANPVLLLTQEAASLASLESKLEGPRNNLEG